MKEKIYLDNEDFDKISHFIIGILKEKNITIKDDWENDFSKEDDFYRLINEIEDYINLVNNYE